MMNDYNGPDEWSVEGVQRRYAEAARCTGQSQLRDLTPREHSVPGQRWIYPVIEAVIAGAKQGDAASIEVATQFVESGHRQAFGRILHANAARALRQAQLTSGQKARLRKRILGMLVAGDVPHEFHAYVRLLRKIGLDESWPEVRARVDESNRYVMRHVRYLEKHASLDV
jgi:hypothetical protein